MLQRDDRGGVLLNIALFTPPFLPPEKQASQYPTLFLDHLNKWLPYLLQMGLSGEPLLLPQSPPNNLITAPYMEGWMDAATFDDVVKPFYLFIVRPQSLYSSLLIEVYCRLRFTVLLLFLASHQIFYQVGESVGRKKRITLLLGETRS